MDKTLMLADVRCAFLALGEPEDYQGNKKFRWGAVGLVPYESALKKKVDAKLLEIAKDAWGAKGQAHYDAIISDRKACAFVDGKFKPDYDGYAGHFALSAYRYVDKGRPLVFTKDKQPVYKPNNELYEGMGGKLYSGMRVNMHVEFWAQDNGNGKALRCTLLGIQAFKDADAFGGGKAPDADAFGEVATDDDEALS